MISHWQNGNSPPKTPFYAVIFISRKREIRPGYRKMDEYLMDKVQELEGYLGYSSASGGGEDIFISYWSSREAIDIWRRDPEHKKAKFHGPKDWYDYYHSMICRVESSTVFKVDPISSLT